MKIIQLLLRKLISILFVFSDSKAEANHFMWENDFKRRKRGPKKRGNPQITLEDLAAELEMKKEKIARMEQSVTKLLDRARNEVIDASDLEEYEALLASDEDESDIEADARAPTRGMYTHDKCVDTCEKLFFFKSQSQMHQPRTVMRKQYRRRHIPTRIRLISHVHRVLRNQNQLTIPQQVTSTC